MSRALGWDDTAEKEFLKALRQPLINQTPLMVLVESLFVRIQSQSKVISDMTEKIERFMRSDVKVEELLYRTSQLENSLQYVTDTKLSPFQQQEIFRRLEDVERVSNKLNSVTVALKEENVPDLTARLTRVEQRLVGVYNLGGKLHVVDDIASAFNLSVPNLESSSGTTSRSENQKSLRPPSATSSPRASQLHALTQARIHGLHRTGVDATSVEELIAQVTTLREDNSKLSECMLELNNQTDGIEATMKEMKETQEKKIGEVEDSVRHDKWDMQAQIKTLREYVDQLPRVEPEDLKKLEELVQSAAAELAEQKARVASVTEKELPKFHEAVQELRDSIKRIDEPREMDSYFNNRIHSLEQVVEGLVDEATGLKSQVGEVLRSSLSGLVREADLEPLLSAVTTKASMQELRMLARQLAELTHHVNDMTELVYARSGESVSQSRHVRSGPRGSPDRGRAQSPPPAGPSTGPGPLFLPPVNAGHFVPPSHSTSGAAGGGEGAELRRSPLQHSSSNSVPASSPLAAITATFDENYASGTEDSRGASNLGKANVKRATNTPVRKVQSPGQRTAVFMG